MSTRLYIRLQDQDGEWAVEWLSVDDQSRQTAYGAGDETELAKLDQPRQLTLLFPASRVTMARFQIPATNPKFHRQAARSLIEDRLIDDIDDMHLIVNPVPDNLLDVATIARDELQQMLDTLSRHNLQADTAIPDALVLPLQENTWTIYEDENEILIRLGRLNAISLNRQWLSQETVGEMLAGLSDISPEQLQVYRHPETEEANNTIDYASAFPQAEISTITLEAGQGLIDFALEPTRLDPAINFLKGEFAPKQSLSHRWINWRLPVYAAAAGLLLFSLNLFILNHIQQSRLEDTRSEIDTLFRQTFPQITTIVDYRLQFQRELDRHTSQMASDGPNLRELHDILASLKQSGDMVPQRISWSKDHYMLDIDSADMASAKQFIENINQMASYQAKLLSAQNQDQRTRIRVQIGRQG